MPAFDFYLCTLITADMPDCHRPAVIEIEDVTGDRGWGCAIHALQALRGIEGARIVRDLTVPEVRRGDPV